MPSRYLRTEHHKYRGRVQKNNGLGCKERILNMNQQAQNKRSFPYVALILGLTALLVVFVLGYTLMDSTGLLGRMDTAAKSDNIRLSENELDVYRYHVAQNDLYYQYMYVQYGLANDPTGGLIQYMDANTFINYMLPTTVGTGAYDETAYAYAEQYLTYCEGAKEAGLYDSYKAEIEADIDEYMESLKTSAEANGITFGSYLKNFIGTGVGKSDIRSAMEYYFIGGKYAEKLVEDYDSAVTEDEIIKHRDENKDKFYTTAYSSYKLVSDTMKAAIEACTTIDEVKTVIVDHYMDQKFEDNYKTNFTDKDVEDTAGKDQTKADVRTTLLAMNNIGENESIFTSADTDAYKAAAYAIVKAINSSVSTETAKISETTAAWADPAGTSATELQKWLFGDGRKEGDTKVIETKTTSGETTTTTYTWYIVEEDVMVLDEEFTKNAHYILLTDDAEDVENGKTAKEKAEAFHAALTATNTAEKFEDLVKEYAPGYSAALVEHISYVDMAATYEDLADWLYEAGRKVGDVSDMIEIKDDKDDADKVTGYIVALFMGENEETWKVDCTEAIAGEKLTAWYDEAVEKYHVEIDYSHEGHDHDHDEETTAA